MSLLLAPPSTQWQHECRADGRARVVVRRLDRCTRLLVGDLPPAGAGVPRTLLARSAVVDPSLQVAVDQLAGMSRAGVWESALGVDLGDDGTVTVAAAGGPGAILVGVDAPGRLVPAVPDGVPHVGVLAPGELVVLCTPTYLADPPDALRRLRLGGLPSQALRRALLGPGHPGAVAVAGRTPEIDPPA